MAHRFLTAPGVAVLMAVGSPMWTSVIAQGPSTAAVGTSGSVRVTRHSGWDDDSVDISIHADYRMIRRAPAACSSAA